MGATTRILRAVRGFRLLDRGLLIVAACLVIGGLWAERAGLVTLALVLLAAAFALSFGAWRVAERRRVAAAAEVGRYAELASRRADQVSILSHEIRTPLAIIKGSAELLAEETPGPLNERQRVFARRIADNAGQVIELSENLLAHARIEAGVFELHLDHVNLRSLLRQAVRELRQVLDADVQFDSFEPPIRMLVDPGLIKQVVANLVTNAVRNSAGDAPVTVRMMRRDSDLLVSVSDHGSGMTAQQQEQLFRRFASGSADRGGTGLGMYVSQHIVRLHGGMIYVDTIAQRGTTVLFTLPFGREGEEHDDDG
ncbi:sensor histidine kinase [Microbacterium sp. gxy059]|uniref:sensor histidine kinase n=1 Tax=Microbacterium sp. gxy059 TaxID=2957199 RepID=UPI003D977C5C